MSKTSNRVTRRASRRLRARVALGLVAVFAACDVYDSQLISTAVGTGGRGTGATGGTEAGAGQAGKGAGSAGVSSFVGGTAGVGGSTGGASGTGSTAGSGGAVANGGTGGMEGGADGDGGEDPGVGGSAGMGGSSGSGGVGGSSGGGAGGVGGGGGAGAGGAGGAGKGGGGAGGSSAGGAGGAAGTGGAGGAGAGGTAGKGGTGGAGTGGTGGAGTGGTGGTAGTGGSPPATCTGCARLSVPLTATADKARFTLLLAASSDLSAATITFRVAKVSGTGGSFTPYIQEGASPFTPGFGTPTTIASLGASMQNITLNVAAVTTTANKAAIGRIGIQIDGASGASWTNPTVIYVDSIVVTGSTLNPSSWPFDTAGTVHTTPTGQGPVGLIYFNNYSADSNVMASISWQGP